MTVAELRDLLLDHDPDNIVELHVRVDGFDKHPLVGDLSSCPILNRTWINAEGVGL